MNVGKWSEIIVQFIDILKKKQPINEHFTGYKLNEIKMTNTYKQWMKAKTFTI